MAMFLLFCLHIKDKQLRSGNLPLVACKYLWRRCSIPYVASLNFDYCFGNFANNRITWLIRHIQAIEYIFDFRPNLFRYPLQRG